MFCHNITVFADTAISVPQDAKRSIENAKNDLEILKEKKREIRYKKDAADYVSSMQQAYDKTWVELEEAKENERNAEIDRQNAEMNRQNTEAAKESAQTMLEQVRNDYNQLADTVNAAFRSAEDAQRDAARIFQECYDREAEIQRQVDAANQAGTELDGDPAIYLINWSRAVQAKNGANQLQEQADETAAQLPALEAAVQAAERVVVAADRESNSAKQKAIAAQNSVNLAQENVSISSNNLQTLAKGLQESKIHQSQLLYRLAHPPAIGGFSQSMNYYSWKDSYGNSGNQLSHPLYYGYYSPQNPLHIGVFTSLVSANHDSYNGSGSIFSTTDTSLQLDKTNEKKNFSTKYILQVSLPTGKSTWSNGQLNARMSDDLVELGQYGEGFKLQPGLETSWHTTEADKWTVGTNILWSQAYDQAADIPNDTIHPGYEWEKKVQYQHAQDKWQLVSELIHTNYGRSTFDNGNSYHLGNGWQYRMTYNRTFAPGQDVLFYYWQENSGRNDVETISTHYAPVHYYGTRWSNSLDEKRTIYLHFDAMNTNGNRYAGFENGHYLEVRGRDKYTLGAGYKFKFDQAETVNFDLQYFQMHDGVSTLGDPARSYHGWNMLLSYNRSW